MMLGAWHDVCIDAVAVDLGTAFARQQFVAIGDKKSSYTALAN